MTDTKFTVQMHATLIDQLDEIFSPRDAVAAINELFLELPRFHPEVPKRFRERANRNLRVFRGGSDWHDLAFSYVQIRSTLHVLELWNDADWAFPTARNWIWYLAVHELGSIHRPVAD